MIIGAKKSSRTNKVSLLVKFNGTAETSWMPLKMAKVQHTNLVLDFYESIIDFPSINFCKVNLPQANMEVNDEDVEEPVDPAKCLSVTSFTLTHLT